MLVPICRGTGTGRGGEEVVRGCDFAVPTSRVEGATNEAGRRMIVLNEKLDILPSTNL
jgi:hypothetical protein